MLEPICGYLLLAEALHDEGQTFADAWNFGPSNDDIYPVAAVVFGLAKAWGSKVAGQAVAGNHPHEAGLLAVDSARARLGWRPQLDLDTALAWTGRWYRQHHDGSDAYELMNDDIREYQNRFSAQQTPL